MHCYRAISQDTPERMAESVAHYRSEGYRRFQLKVGSSVEVDIARIKRVVGLKSAPEIVVADANTCWLTHEALRVVHAVRDLDVTIEQPCVSFEENLEYTAPHRSALRPRRKH